MSRPDGGGPALTGGRRQEREYSEGRVTFGVAGPRLSHLQEHAPFADASHSRDLGAPDPPAAWNENLS